MDGPLAGKVSLVTGSGAGIGRATALEFAAQGAYVAVCDINVSGGEETVRLITHQGGQAVFIKADISLANDVTNLVTKTVEAFGRLDCACNNAGVEGRSLPLIDQTEADYDATMGINAKGTFLCLQAEIREMLKAGGGAIVNVASVAGLIGFPGLAPYVASKHAINGMTKNAALEYGKEGIRVNSVCPGGIDTRMLNDLVRDQTGGKKTTQEFMNPLHPIGRIGSPQEVAQLVVWLCSGQASFVTGAIIPIDGGFVAQ